MLPRASSSSSSPSSKLTPSPSLLHNGPNEHFAASARSTDDVDWATASIFIMAPVVAVVLMAGGFVFYKNRSRSS